MRHQAHESVTPADVRGTPLRRHAVRRFDGGRIYAVVTGSGWPRYWGFTHQAVLRGFAHGLTQSAELSPSVRLSRAVDEARAALISSCEELIERTVPDAGLAACSLSSGSLYLVVVGDARAYLRRGRNPTRLTPRQPSQGGLMTGKPVTTETVLDPDDLVLMGSASAFSEAAINRVSRVLEEDGHSPPTVIASLMTEPAGRAGVGAAAVAARIL